jgi:hypothetical protein
VEIVYGDDGMSITFGPWHFDPVDQNWFARTGPNTWSVVEGDPDDPPRFHPVTGANL